MPQTKLWNMILSRTQSPLNLSHTKDWFLTLLYILPETLSYRYLPDQSIMPYYYGEKSNSITSVEYYPHHVLIVYGSKYCSGSLIYSKIVMTAASCFTKNNGEAVIVKVGANSMTGSGQIIPVVEYKVHEYFEQFGALDNDIALLVLEKNVVFGKSVIKAVLVEPEAALREGTSITITGWGGTNMSIKYVNLLLKAETTVLSKTICKNIYGNMLATSNFCVKFISEQVMNDNGGGVIFDKTLVGILSTVVTDKINFNTALITNVSYFHRWITLNTKRFLTKYCVVQEDSYDENIETDET